MGNRIALSLGLAGALAGGIAQAQEAASAAAPVADEAVALEEIVVTAQKRSESLQETPISIEAFNADKLEQRGVQGVADLALQVPGMTVEPFPTHNATLRIFIRGVGINDAQLTQDPPVGVYVDGVYIARSVGLALDLADLERIEVLRGPQGTLYGRNTTGGTLNLITRRPDPSAFTMTHALTLGDRSIVTGKSSFNVPVTETLAFKLALLGSSRDGHVENTGPGADFGDRKEQALRFDARWFTPFGITADYAFDWTDMRYANYMFQALLEPATNKGQAELFKPFAVANSVYAPHKLDALASGPPMEESGTRILGHALTLTAPLGEQELKYILGYRDLRDEEYADLGGGKGSLDYRLDSHAYDGPAAQMANGGPTPLVIPTVTQSQSSHELQLSGRLFNDSVDYIVGAFHFRETATEDRNRLNHQFSTALEPQQIGALVNALPAQLGQQILAFAGPRLVNFVNLRWDIANRASALFGQATWTPPFADERLHFTVGYRHSRDEREAVKFRISETYVEGAVNGTGTAVPLESGEFFNNVPAASRFRDDAWSWNLGFDLAPAVYLYAKSAQAYKSGGYNVRDPHIDANSADNTYGFGFVDGFAPERVHSYEVGLKSEWLDRRLRVNADVFSSDYSDMQINFLIPGTISDSKTRNAGKARLRGGEASLTWAAARRLTLLADYAYLDARVLEVIDQDGSNVASQYPFVSAPRHSGVLAADAQLLDRGWGQLRAYLTYSYTGQRSGGGLPGREGLTSLPTIALINARLTAAGIRAGESGSLDLALWGRNLADKEYPIAAIDNLPHADRAVIWGEPRTLGVDLIYRFF